MIALPLWLVIALATLAALGVVGIGFGAWCLWQLGRWSMETEYLGTGAKP
jgi:hypothetical protein